MRSSPPPRLLIDLPPAVDCLAVCVSWWLLARSASRFDDVPAPRQAFGTTCRLLVLIGISFMGSSTQAGRRFKV